MRLRALRIKIRCVLAFPMMTVWRETAARARISEFVAV